MAGSIFSGIEGAQVYGSGNFIAPGKYSVEIEALKTHSSGKVAGRVYFVVEAKILEIHIGGDGQAVGESVTWLVDMTKKSALGNVKGFALALVPGVTAADITEDQLLSLVSADNPAAGLRVKLRTFMTKTQAGGDFTVHNWSPIEATDDDASAES